MARYWVVGGEYKTTNFEELVAGAAEERHGPYETVEAARAKWAERAMATVDNAHVRFRIDKDASTRWYVVGGRYTDTDFTRPMPGTAEERLGPYATRGEAVDVWRERAWATVDDAFAAYRIEEA
jgi:hypothetical protein